MSCPKADLNIYFFFQHPALPPFESDDLKKLANEIAMARRYLAQSRSYRAMYESLKEVTRDKVPHAHVCE